MTDAWDDWEAQVVAPSTLRHGSLEDVEGTP